MTWDYIVVGAGSAGCALAYELSRSAPHKTILVLEAGGSDRSPAIRFAASQVQAIAQHDFGYRCQPDPSRNGVTESWPRGCVLGGCSSINGTMFVRGAAEDFDGWARQTGDASWSSSAVMPLFRELETSDRPGPLRGHEGPLYVRTVKHPQETTEAFIKAAVSCGHPFNPDYNAESQEGVAYAQLSQRRGLRWSAADAFLKPLLGRKNLKLLLNARVLKIELREGRAVAIVFRKGKREERVTGHDIILSAGAIDSPRLLMLSGIAASEELVRHRIPVMLDLPAVGRHLKEHALVKVIYRMRIPTSNLTEGWPQKLRFLLQFLRTGEGPISNLFEATAFLKSGPQCPHPDLQLHFMTFGYSVGQDGKAQLARFPSVTVLLNQSYPQGEGAIRLASANPDDPPRIECRLLERQADIDTLVRGVQVIRKIMASAPITGLIEEETAPGGGTEDADALTRYLREHTGIAFHPAGTCRMGNDPDAVVGSDLRVHGTENLWIADASIMPGLISGNTNAVCMMIGMKLGRELASRRSP